MAASAPQGELRFEQLEIVISLRGDCHPEELGVGTLRGVDGIARDSPSFGGGREKAQSMYFFMSAGRWAWVGCSDDAWGFVPELSCLAARVINERNRKTLQSDVETPKSTASLPRHPSFRDQTSEGG